MTPEEEERDRLFVITVIFCLVVLGLVLAYTIVAVTTRTGG